MNIVKIKLIWDFRGPDGLRTAEHHCIHLKEYAAIENLTHFGITSNQISEVHSIASIVVERKDMISVRDALKPHRGELA